MLAVDPATPRTADPADYLRVEEARLTDGDALPGYEKVGIEPLDLYQGGAEWECSWLTREFDWQVNRAYLPMIRQSFRPSKISS